MKTFRSYDHSVYTIDTKKMSLNSFDNKRFLVTNIDTLAHGHFSTLKGWQICQTLMGQFGTFAEIRLWQFSTTYILPNCLDIKNNHFVGIPLVIQFCISSHFSRPI